MFMEQPFDKITKVFKDKDKGNRGVITEQQLRRVMIQIGQDATEFDDLVAGFKGGREGQEVNYEDFVKWLLDDAVVNSHPRERVVDIFQSFDPSNTGRVSASCLYAVLKGIEKCQGEADQMFEETQRSCSAVVGDQVDYRTWLDWLFSDMPARSPFAYFAHPRSDTLTVERAIDPTTEVAGPLRRSRRIGTVLMRPVTHTHTPYRTHSACRVHALHTPLSAPRKADRTPSKRRSATWSSKALPFSQDVCLSPTATAAHHMHTKYPCQWPYSWPNLSCTAYLLVNSEIR